MGLTRVIETGGHFPTVANDASKSLEELDAGFKCNANRPSFGEEHGQETSPALALIQEQVEAGFARIFADQESAEECLGNAVHPAPLGNVTKLRPDGSLKHRLIQDLKANDVNLAAQV